jgi:hypothetical protein
MNWNAFIGKRATVSDHFSALCHNLFRHNSVLSMESFENKVTYRPNATSFKRLPCGIGCGNFSERWHCIKVKGPMLAKKTTKIFHYLRYRWGFGQKKMNKGMDTILKTSYLSPDKLAVESFLENFLTICEKFNILLPANLSGGD